MRMKSVSKVIFRDGLPYLELSKDAWARISLEDVEELGKHAWHFSGRGYAAAAGGVYLHRYIMAVCMKKPILPGFVVDHIDRDKLNNTRENLRLVSQADNVLNSKLVDNAAGVCLNSREGKWKAYIERKGRIWLGTYATQAEAISARKLAEGLRNSALSNAEYRNVLRCAGLPVT